MGGRTGGINSRESEARDRTERDALSTWTSCISTGIESGCNHPSTGSAGAPGAFGRGSLETYASLFTRGDQLREGVTIEQHIQGRRKGSSLVGGTMFKQVPRHQQQLLFGISEFQTQITELLERSRRWWREIVARHSRHKCMRFKS